MGLWLFVYLIGLHFGGGFDEGAVWGFFRCGALGCRDGELKAVGAGSSKVTVELLNVLLGEVECLLCLKLWLITSRCD